MAINTFFSPFYMQLTDKNCGQFDIINKNIFCQLFEVFSPHPQIGLAKIKFLRSFQRKGEIFVFFFFFFFSRDQRERERDMSKKIKLLPHEQTLVSSGALENISHNGASSVWLHSPSTPLETLKEGETLVYRVMGDIEFHYLFENGVLPSSQPYQTIVEGEEGRKYVEKYLRGKKKVDSSPTTVVEFRVKKKLVEDLFHRQKKIEDGCISHGLGEKGGNGLNDFNEALKEFGSGDGEIMEKKWRIVTVKRSFKK